MGVTAGRGSAIEWEQARQQIVEAVQQQRQELAFETVPLLSAHNRVLGGDLHADRDYPSLARSLRDGFAVHSSDTPGTLPVRGEWRAGTPVSEALPKGSAIEIMTGAPIPEGCDAIVMVENVERDEYGVTICETPQPGQFVNECGSEARKGSLLIKAGTRLDTSHIATLAMTGNPIVKVVKKPRVAILSTGDELVAIDEHPAPHQIRNSNSYALAALITAAGGEPDILPVAPDTASGLSELLERGLERDLLLISGGVSAGKYDLVKPCLRRLGAEFFFERVRIQPGQPTAFGHGRGKFVFGLPGNPGSSMVTFLLFARAALDILCGRQDCSLQILHAIFEAPFRHKPGLTRFLPARLGENGRLTHVPWQGSSDIPALAKANAFLIADADRAEWMTGETIRVILKL